MNTSFQQPPAGPLPAGFLLFGRGPLLIPAAEEQMRDVAIWWDDDDESIWDIGGYDGLSSANWYALREGSSIAAANLCQADPAAPCITLLQTEINDLRRFNQDIIRKYGALIDLCEDFRLKVAALLESRPAGGGGDGGS